MWIWCGTGRFLAELLDGRTGFAAEQVLGPDFFVAAAANQRDFNQLFRCVVPAVVLQPDQLTAVAPRVRIGIAAVVQVAEESQIFSVHQMLADEGFMADPVFPTANGGHSHLKNKISVE